MDAARLPERSTTNCIDEPLYNSRLLKNYVEYVRRVHPEIDVAELIREAGLSPYELEDQAVWFTQRQVSRFHDVLQSRAGDPEISRKVGRFAATSQASGIVRQYALGFMSPSTAYRMLERIAANLSRSFTLRTYKIGPDAIEIRVRIKPGVREKPQQCENRLGLFEALAKLFTNTFAHMEHPECVHRGDSICRYVVRWERPSFLPWKRVASFFTLMAVVTLPGLPFLLPPALWAPAVLSGTVVSLGLYLVSEHLQKVHLAHTVKAQGEAAQDHLHELNARYNNALLVQEIGQAISRIMDPESLVRSVTKAMDRRLDYDRGMIMLANEDKSRLVYASGYGYDRDVGSRLKELSFHLDNPDSRGVFVKAFKDQQPFLLTDMAAVENTFSRRSRQTARELGIESLICVPIVYQEESLGILAVDNIRSKRPLTQSDVNLLLAVAAQTAVSIVNARSYQRLQESEKKYRDLVENANSIIMRVDIHGKITFFNEFAQGYFGYAEEEIIGRNILQTLLPNTPETRRSLARLIAELRHNPDRIVVNEEEGTLRNWQQVWIAWTFKPIFDEGGKLQEVLCIGNDITELKRAGEEKQFLEKQLQQAQKMEAIGTLAGGIAHDFNNILSAIIGYTELALYGLDDTSPLRSKLQSVLEAGHRAKDLVQQILAFSRQSEDERKPVQVHLIVKEALKLLRASLPTTIEIRQQIDTKAGASMANPTHIHQVVMNLCTNAHHAMADTGGTLEVRLSAVELAGESLAAYPELEPGPYLELVVKDTGHGMDQATLERIFEPYFTTKDKGVGTGLGLSVVHGIVKRHGGGIRVESSPGKGTAFHVLLPRLAPPREREAAEEETISRGHERILFVDDEAALAELGREMLQSLGYQAESRTDSLEALEAFRADPNRYDLVITDMTMPHLTGDRLATEIMAIRPGTPVILCTGFNEQMTEERAKALGIREFLYKPVVLEHLARKIRHVLDTGGESGSPALH